MNKQELLESAKEGWGQETAKSRLEYPDESVVRYLAGKRRSSPEAEVLDFGCGEGRHSVLMAKMGFHVTAVDYNKECMDTTREILEKNAQAVIRTVQNTGNDIPLEDSSYDCIIAWGSLYSGNREDSQKILASMNRILKMDGEVFANWRTRADFLYGKGQEIEENVFYLDETSGRAGYQYYFPELKELDDIYRGGGFEIINTETSEFTMDNRKRLNSWYHITARKLRDITLVCG